jgi:prepilin signal peptidase PulO-like enzyme (type II secretory pathway)
LPSLIKKTKNLSSQIPFGPYIVLGITIHIILRHII